MHRGENRGQHLNCHTRLPSFKPPNIGPMNPRPVGQGLLGRNPRFDPQLPETMSNLLT